MPIRPHFLDQVGIETNALLSRLRNLSKKFAVKPVVFGVIGNPITMMIEP